MTEPNQKLKEFYTIRGKQFHKHSLPQNVCDLKKANRSAVVRELDNHSTINNNQAKQNLRKLNLSKSFIGKAVIKQVDNYPDKISTNKCQGYYLDKSFISGNTNKRSRSGDDVAQGAGHYLDTANLGKKKNKFAVFSSGDDKLKLLVVKNGLSKEGKLGLELMEKMHIIVDPIICKLCCKISGMPIGQKIDHGLKKEKLCESWGAAEMQPQYIMKKGRSCTMCYLNKYDQEKHFQIENPVNRLNMYSIGEIEEIWNGNEQIQGELGVFEGKNKNHINAYFRDMKLVYKNNMPYFFKPADRVKYKADEMVEAYFGKKFHFSSNMFDENSPCACHHDTIPDQKEFPSGITAMASKRKGETTRRTMGRGDGELCFVHLGCNVQYNHGDVVLMNPALYHGLLPLAGPRYSLVLYNNRSTMKNPNGESD